MKRFSSVARALTLALLLVAALRPLNAQATGVPVRNSEKFEALLMVDVLGSTDPKQSDYPKLREILLPALESNAAAKEGLEAWKGQGNSLCYLFTDCGGESLTDVIAALTKGGELFVGMEKGIEDPTCKAACERLKTEGAKLVSFLQFLQTAGFAKIYTDAVQALLVPGNARVTELLAKVDSARLLTEVQRITGKTDSSAIECYHVNFAGLRSFPLKGNRVAIGYALRETAPYYLVHELCHRFDPSEGVIASVKALAEQDPFYAKAHKRIHADFNRGYEESLVQGAALHVCEVTGLLRHKQALRLLKFAYSVGDGMPSDHAGSPLAGILFASLTATPPADGFQYDAFIAKQFADGVLASGKIEAKYEEAIAEVLGIAGLTVELKDGRMQVAKVAAGFPAAEGGLQAGDEVVKVMDVEVKPPVTDLLAVMDVLAGKRGDERTLSVKRGDQMVEVKFKLK